MLDHDDSAGEAVQAARADLRLPAVPSGRRVKAGRAVKRMALALSALIVPAVAVTACGSGGTGFSSSAQVAGALSKHGVPCSGITYVSNSVEGGVGTIAECSGTSTGDTSIAVFDNHTDAIAFARSMAGLYGAVEVVGLNWVVNTKPSYAMKVHGAIGGEIVR
jgi:hypothetical protein